MQTAQIDNGFNCVRPLQEPTFSSVWGNEMQREDFLALAAGLRQYNASLGDPECADNDAISSMEAQGRRD